MPERVRYEAATMGIDVVGPLIGHNRGSVVVQR
jgi:hypothetical protein